MSTVLVVGGTGELGREIVQQLCAAKHTVRALVRLERQDDAIAWLTGLGVEFVRGDLKEPASLAAACRNIDVVVSSATSTSPNARRTGDSIETVDREGQLSLVDAALAARVGHFVLVSFADIEFPELQGKKFELHEAKTRLESRLAETRGKGMTHTVLKPAYFMETWLAGLARGQGVTLFGEGHGKVSWVSRSDVARYAVAAVSIAGMRDSTIKVGGPEALSQLQVIELAQSLGAPLPSEIARAPEGDLVNGLAGADLQQAFSALMLGIARGLVVPTTPVANFSPPAATTVREFVRRELAAQG